MPPTGATGWKIQIAAAPTRAGAEDILDRALSTARGDPASAKPLHRTGRGWRLHALPRPLRRLRQPAVARAACAYLVKHSFGLPGDRQLSASAPCPFGRVTRTVLAMSAEKPVLSLVDFRRQERRASLIGVHGLHQPAVGRPDFRLSGAGKKAKDLIGLLVSHGARIRRAARPRCVITLDVFTPAGDPAVEISFE